MLVQQPDRNQDYRLVILTSTLQHYITSCFDENQVESKFPSLPIKIEEYVKKHLVVGNEVETASTVDTDHSSVRVVFAEQAGMGKSLYVARRRSDLDTKFHGEVYWNSTTIRFLEKSVNIDDVVMSLWDSEEEVCNKEPHFVHIDITPSVQSGVQKFLFDLIILGKITSSLGRVWRHHPQHFYVIEYTTPSARGSISYANILGLLPSVTCLTPMEVKSHLENKTEQRELENLVMIDNELLMSPTYQRPYQYLYKYSHQEDLDNFVYHQPKNNPLEFLDTLLKFCSIEEPSWLELSHFCRFLNTQLNDCEKSDFCIAEAVGPTLNFDAGLAGFKKFVVRFMIRMSQDFATPSLSDKHQVGNKENDLLELHQLRRRWENNLHPYMFFNDDRFSMSFVHFNINNKGDLCHPVTNENIQAGIMTNLLFRGLRKQGVNLSQNFDLVSREDKLATLCNVFGVKRVIDPDPTYELTTDNVLKMLAIHMRFRCGIPVVIMGETGCGKTRMVEFMSKLKSGEVSKERKVKNMVVVKVHGGVTVGIIQEKVRDAINLAQKNKEDGNLETVLFLDEANTTEAIYAIKEVVCDGTVHGKSFVDTGLKIVAACNPYKMHSAEMIAAMEKSQVLISRQITRHCRNILEYLCVTWFIE
ncbi:E3 ubiquitin-protein ligase rnf213-beta-like [Ciona intestinalis]